MSQAGFTLQCMRQLLQATHIQACKWYACDGHLTPALHMLTPCHPLLLQHVDKCRGWAAVLSGFLLGPVILQCVQRPAGESYLRKSRSPSAAD